MEIMSGVVSFKDAEVEFYADSQIFTPKMIDCFDVTYSLKQKNLQINMSYRGF